MTKETFEQWYADNAFNYEENPIGSRDCSLQRKAWNAGQQALRDELAKGVEPVAYIRRDQLGRAQIMGMLCEITPEPRQDRIGIYTSPPDTLAQLEAMREQRDRLAALCLEAIEGSRDYVEQAKNRHIEEYGERFRAHRIEYMDDVMKACDSALEALAEVKGGA